MFGDDRLWPGAPAQTALARGVGGRQGWATSRHRGAPFAPHGSRLVGRHPPLCGQETYRHVCFRRIPEALPVGNALQFLSQQHCQTCGTSGENVCVCVCASRVIRPCIRRRAGSAAEAGKGEKEGPPALLETAGSASAAWLTVAGRAECDLLGAGGGIQCFGLTASLRYVTNVHILLSYGSGYSDPWDSPNPSSHTLR